MEYFASVTTPGGHTADPWQECRGFAAGYQGSCVRYQTLAFAQRGETSLKTFMACQRLESLSLRGICFESIGFHAAQIAKGAAAAVRRACSFAGEDEGQQACLVAAARETIFQNYENAQNTAAALCRDLSPNWQSGCLEGVDEASEAYDQ